MTTTTKKQTAAALAKALLTHPDKEQIAKDLADDLADRFTGVRPRLERLLSALGHTAPQPRTVNAFLKGPPRRTEAWLGKQLGVSQSYVSLMRKHKRTPRLSLVRKLVKVTGIPYDTLVEDLVTRNNGRRRK